MDILKYKQFEGSSELDMARHVCWGKLLFIDDLVTYESDSVGGLQQEFEAAVEDYIQTCAVIGKEPQRPLRGLFNVRVSPTLHRAATLRAMEESVSLNEIIVRAIDAFLNSRSEVNHNVKVALEGMTTIQVAASESLQWKHSNVH